MLRPQPDPTGPGQESVWEYPRPPAVERTHRRLKIVHRGELIAETTAGYRVLETSHPPVDYFPPTDCRLNWLPGASAASSFCEFKGAAKYVNLSMPGQPTVQKVGWFYPQTQGVFEPIARFLAFYAGPLDACYVDDQPVTPQPGEFYGGWITPDLAGPFKGVPGSMGW